MQEKRRKILHLAGAVGLLWLAGCSSTKTGTSSQSKIGAIQIDERYRQEIVLAALGLIGTPYRYGGSTDTGFDCSGLVRFLFQQVAGINLPHNASAQYKLGRTIGIQQLSQGDLVFFNTTGKAHSHMGLYIGNQQFVHAPSSGGNVRTDALSTNYYAQRIDGSISLFKA